jgi:hypothetical protein
VSEEDRPIRFTPDQLEEIFHAALGAGDIRGVECALTVLAVRDPHRAQRLMDLTRMVLIVAEVAR